MSKQSALSFACVVLLASACGERGRTSGEFAAVDTLANGRIVVANSSTGQWQIDSQWVLREDLRIGRVEGEGPDVFGGVSAIEVDQLGRIWVLDRQARELRVFGADGTHVRTVGRGGEGPGEFTDPIGLALHPNGEMWVVDPGNARYSVFDTNGTYVTQYTRQIAGYTVPWRGGFDRAGRLVEASSALIGAAFRPALFRHDELGQPVDTFVVPRYDAETFELQTPAGARMTANVPFTPTLVWSFDVDRGVWSGINSQYRIYEQTFIGDTVRIVSREHGPVPVTREDREEAVEQLAWFTEQGGQVDPSRIPSRKPAFSQMHISSDGHLWVRPILTQDEAGTVFDVFDPEGIYLGRVVSAATFTSAVLFRDDRLYGAARDTLGVAYVVRMRVVVGVVVP